MAWTTFAALTNPTLPELDANFSTLTYLAPVTCTILGTNTLTLTAINAGTPIAGYQQNMQLTGIAAATNTTTVVAALGALPLLPVYMDTLSGPVALTGGEIVQNCPLTLFYDQALNSNAGGFHLGVSNGSILIGQTVSLTSLNAVGASLTGVLRAASVSFAGGDAVVRMSSTVVGVAYTAAIVPGAQATPGTFSIPGAAVNDCIVLGLPSSPPASIGFFGYVPAAGTVLVVAYNRTPATTITPNVTISMRITDIGFAT